MILIKAKELKTLAQKIQGLMFVKEPQPIFFLTRWGIHTFFMRFEIDVVVLDDKDRVVGIYEDLKPWRIVMWNPKYERVLELPQGSVKTFYLSKDKKVNIDLI